MINIPGFEIKKQLYECDTYAVFRGVRGKDIQPVIIKIQRGEDLSIAFYQHEYDILQSLDGDGIVKALDLITDQEAPIIIYEDIGAESLDNLMADTVFSMSERLKIAIGITSALDQIHHAGYLHKCINPANILYNSNTGRVQLINFELTIELISDQMYSDGSEVTQKTMAYISPEQTGRMKRSLDYRSDLYSLGVVLYQLFSGKVPFESTDALELIHSHIAKIPLPPIDVNTVIPRVVSDIIVKLMAKEAAQRYQSAAGLKYDLSVCRTRYEEMGRIAPFTLQENDISDQLRISGKLYGRSDEINVLKTAFSRAIAGSLEHVYVTGYAGIGKTALVREVLQQYILGNAEMTLLFGIGRFDRFHHDIPYSAITQVLRDVIRQIIAKSDRDLKVWKEKLSKALGRNGRVIADIIPEIEILLGPQSPVPNLGPLESRNRLHLLFQNFIRALSGASHPMVIFIDDLQWADAASLKLIESILTDDELHNFLGIAAYRDDEIGSDHPIHETLDALRNKKVRLTWLRVASLGLESVKSIISDSIRTDEKKVNELGALTLQKTDGNPFFIEMFLKTLLSEQLLTFNRDRNQWQWSISRINELEITDNVADLLIRKIDRLSENAQKILKWASCIGLEFDLTIYSAVSSQALTKINTVLKEAVVEGVVVPIDHSHKQTKGGAGINQKLNLNGYRFAHSRIRQAIYTSMSDNEKQRYHSLIGEYLLENMASENKEKQLFPIVNHLNVGSKLESASLTGDKLAQFNIDAGLKAKASAAFHPALNYFRHGIRILGNNRWKDSYGLALNLFDEAAETAYLCGRYKEMDNLAGEVLEYSRSLLDTINVYETIINSYIARYQLEDAIKTAIDVLRKLNVRLPDKVGRWKLFKGYMGAKSTLAWKDVRKLAQMGQMTDRTNLAIMQILKSIGSAAYIAKQDLLAISTFKAVQLSTKYGNAPESASFYAAYGLILCGIMGDIDTGYRFGQLSLDLIDKYNLQGVTSQVGHMVNAFINHWKTHIRETLTPLEIAYKRGFETGNFEYAGYCALFFCHYSFLSGIELPEVERRFSEYSKSIRRFKHEFTLYNHELLRQTVANLTEMVDDPCRLSGSYFDETRQLYENLETLDKTTLSTVYLVKLFLNYLFGEPLKAVEYANLTLLHKEGLVGSMNTPILYFYDSLSSLSLYSNSTGVEQNIIIKKITNNQKKMKHWAKHAPMNHQHKYDLVEAERLAVQGAETQAEKYYRQAAKLAKKHGYRNEEALILERTALFYEKTGRRKQAADTMMKARAAYERWGAMAKVQAIDKSFAFLLVGRSDDTDKRDEKSVVRNDSIIQERKMSKDLDIATIIKATQAISSEIVLEDLLHQLMGIIIENAGAQKGILLLEKEGALHIEATASVDTDEIKAVQSLPLQKSNDLSVEIVRYVERTQESLVVNNAVESDQFFADPYVVKNKPRSVLCMPIVRKKKTTGVLYLENNLATEVFTRERIEILNIILSQAAISLDNALLYESLKKEVTVRELAEKRVLNLATALEHAAEGIMITEPDGTVTHSNPACEKIFGYSREELQGQNTRILRSGYQDKQFFIDTWEILAAGKIWSGRMSCRKKDGGIRELEVTISPILSEDGKIAQFVSVSRDITDEIQMEKELRQAQKMEAIGTLAGGIAHDFNNILAAIMGNTELAIFQAPEDGPVHQNLERVITSAKRAKELVRQILTFSRQGDQKIQPVQMRIIVKEALRMLRATLPTTIEFQLNINSGSDYKVFADPTHLHQIMMNLCTNSAHAMETGGTLTIELDEYLVNAENKDLYSELTPGIYVRLVVRDTGTGIDDKVIDRIFEPFFTTKEQGKGTGMGLAMIHGVVKNCEGDIRVKSEVGKGTEFQVLLPKYEGAQVEAKEEETPKKFLPGQERILFVDDEKALVTLAKEGLKRMGYHVSLETDSTRALKKFSADPQQFDLVITDLTMPQMTGIELSTAMIKIRPDIPIILYSGMMGEISAEKIKEIGIRGFLTKPLMLKQLSLAIRQVLENPEGMFIQ